MKDWLSKEIRVITKGMKEKLMIVEKNIWK